MNENKDLIFDSDIQNVVNEQTPVSVPVVEKKPKNNKGLIIVLILIIIGLSGFIVYDKFIANDKPEEPKVEDTTKEPTENKEETKKEDSETTKKEETSKDNETTTTQKTEEEIVKELYLEKLKQPREQCKLVDYRIDSVKILTGEERKEVISFNEEYQKATDKDIFAIITFSTKFEDINENGCLVGNGSIDGNWLVGQTRRLYIKYENGNYKMEGEGTGW